MVSVFVRFFVFATERVEGKFLIDFGGYRWTRVVSGRRGEINKTTGFGQGVGICFGRVWEMQVFGQGEKREANATVLGMGKVAVVLGFLWKIAGESVGWRVVADVGASGLGCGEPLPACVWAGGRNAGNRAQSGENVHK